MVVVCVVGELLLLALSYDGKGQRSLNSSALVPDQSRPSTVFSSLLISLGVSLILASDISLQCQLQFSFIKHIYRYIFIQYIYQITFQHCRAH